MAVARGKDGWAGKNGILSTGKTLRAMERWEQIGGPLQIQLSFTSPACFSPKLCIHTHTHTHTLKNGRTYQSSFHPCACVYACVCEYKSMCELASMEARG